MSTYAALIVHYKTVFRNGSNTSVSEGLLYYFQCLNFRTETLLKLQKYTDDHWHRSVIKQWKMNRNILKWIIYIPVCTYTRRCFSLLSDIWVVCWVLSPLISNSALLQPTDSLSFPHGFLLIKQTLGSVSAAILIFSWINLLFSRRAFSATAISSGVFIWSNIAVLTKHFK